MTDNERILVTVAILGGTGKEGSALAQRWALHGYRVLIGSRDAAKATARAEELNAELGGDYLVGLENSAAAQQADVAVLTVPYSAHKATLESVREQLQGKLLVDITNPVVPPNIRTVYVPPGKAAALEAREILGDGVRIVSAFQNVSHVKLSEKEGNVDCDILITGDDKDAKQEVMKLVEAAGMRGIDAGPLDNAVAAEALTAVLMYINKTYGVRGSGIRITGL